MEAGIGTSISEELQNPSNGGVETKPKIVVIMGPTGSGKSKLAIDLAAHFPIEIINADSMQVYHGLDVLTNKVTLPDQKGTFFLYLLLSLLFPKCFLILFKNLAGVPHHLLGTINPNVEFTSKDFRDAAIPLIKDILFRNHLPVIVGGTNFYIQALVSPFLFDDNVEEVYDFCLRENLEHEHFEQGNCDYSYDRLKDLDPVAADRIHPNDHRKIRQYLETFMHSGTLPSQLFQGKMTETDMGSSWW